MSDQAALRLEAVRQGRLLAGPETLQLNLVNACNLACIFCWSHSPLLAPRAPTWTKERLSAKHLAEVLAALPKLRPGHVLLSGQGEPLLYPELPTLLSALHEARIPVTVQTNGVAAVPPDQLLGIEHLFVNLSAATAEGYARTHPGHGAHFPRVSAWLEELASAGRFRITLVAVIQRSNQNEITPLLELASRLNATLCLKGMELLAGLEELLLDEHERAAVRDELGRCRERATRLGVALDAGHLEQLLTYQSRNGNFSPTLSRGPCYMGWYYLRLTCAGQVMFCCKDKLVDHLERRPLYQIWRSPAYQLMRLAGRDGDRSAGLFDAKCQTCSNFARNQELHRELHREPAPRAKS